MSQSALPSLENDLDQPLSSYSLTDVQPRPLEWLWPDRIPLAHLTVLYGPSGSGLSLLSLHLAAIVTSGRPWPDGSPCSQGHVVLVAPADSPAHTIKPRFDAAGGDASRVSLLSSVPISSSSAPSASKHASAAASTDSETPSTTLSHRPFSLASDLPLLESIIRRSHAHLVILDTPELARDALFRRLVPQLTLLAQETNCAIVLIRPLTRSLPKTLEPTRLQHLPGLSSVHSALLLAPDPDPDADPDDDPLRLLLTPKHSLAATSPATLSFTIGTESSMLAAPILIWHPLPAGSLTSPALTLLEEVSLTHQAIPAALREHPAPMTAVQLAQQLPLGYEAIRKALQRLRDAGKLVSPARGLYTLPDHPCLQQPPFNTLSHHHAVPSSQWSQN